MSKVKIQQKIPMNTFKLISGQLKAEGIHIITRARFETGEVKQEHIVGRVVSAFNLGAKIEIHTDTNVSCENSRFEKLGNAYYLVAK